MTPAQIATTIAIGLAIAALLLLGLGLARMAKLPDPEDQEPYGDFPSVPHEARK